MDLRDLTRRHRCRPGLLGIEKIALIYGVFTTIIAVIFWDKMSALYSMLIARGIIFAGLAVLFLIYRKFPCKLTFFLRVAYQMGLLAYWYPDTYQFSQLLPNLDNIFAAIDQSIFRCQPALIFSQVFNGAFWTELFSLGYFSYYPMIIFVTLWVFFKNYSRFEKTSFIIICSFLIYFFIFLFVPVAGPQYYYEAVGLDKIQNGIFPALGDWFRYNTDMLPYNNNGGVFQWLVENAQASGERPIAAFPSSHVGISTILLQLARKADKRLVKWLLPFYIILCLATVYIRAHYLIDVFAGFITAFLVYLLAHWLYYLKFFHRKHGYHS